MHLTRYLMMLLIVVNAITACQTTAPMPPVTTADNFTPLMMNARRLEIVDNWQMPVEAPYIGHRAHKLPSNLMADWASRVLLPAGGSGELIFDISRASVMRIELPIKEGIAHLLTDQQESKIKAELTANIMWLQPVGGNQALVRLSLIHI